MTMTIPMLLCFQNTGGDGEVTSSKSQQTYVLFVRQRGRRQEEALVHLGGAGQSHGRSLVQDLGGRLVLVVCVTDRRYGPITVSL